MDILTAAGLLGTTLDVTAERYPIDVRLLHLNSAIRTLSREFETRMTEYSSYFELASGVSQIAISTLGNLEEEQVDVEIVRDLFFTTEYTGTIWSGFTPTGEWTRMQPYSSYAALLTAYTDQEPATPVGYVSYGMNIHVRPIPDEDTLFLAVVDALPRPIQTGECRWLQHDPYSVIYTAAIEACVWLEDEARMPIYERLYTRHVEAMNTIDSERNDGPREMMEV